MGIRNGLEGVRRSHEASEDAGLISKGSECLRRDSEGLEGCGRITGVWKGINMG